MRLGDDFDWLGVDLETILLYYIILFEIIKESDRQCMVVELRLKYY